MEELLQKHKQEKKELQANIQKMKQLVPKNDKKRRKELNQKIDEMETELKKTHQKELNQLNQTTNQLVEDKRDEPIIEQLEQLRINLETNQTNFEKKDDEQQSHKVSKAQRRRERKEREDLEREQRILEGEKNNENHIRIIEINNLDKLLKENNLKLHDIPSDGDCMYKAIEHQLSLQGIKEYDVNVLRKLTSGSLKANKTHYLPFLTSNLNSDQLMNDQEFDQYCNEVETTKKWGGDLELQIISKEISVNIHVYQADGPIIKFECKQPAIKWPLLISYHKYLYQLGAHYNSLVKL